MTNLLGFAKVCSTSAPPNEHAILQGLLQLSFYRVFSDSVHGNSILHLNFHNILETFYYIHFDVGYVKLYMRHFKFTSNIMNSGIFHKISNNLGIV